MEIRKCVKQDLDSFRQPSSKSWKTMISLDGNRAEVFILSSDNKNTLASFEGNVKNYSEHKLTVF